MPEQHRDTDGTYQDRVEVSGRVMEVNIRKKQCQLWLDDTTYVPLTFTEKQEPRIATALQRHKSEWLTVRGRGEFTPDGVLKRIVRADNLNLSHGNDPNAPGIMERIDEIFGDVPDEVWDKVPADLSMRLDYYLYGIDNE